MTQTHPPLPTLTGFTASFWLQAAFLVVAALARLLVPAALDRPAHAPAAAATELIAERPLAAVAEAG